MSMTHQAQVFATACHGAGFTYEVRGSVLTIRQRFTPGDRAAFALADMAASNLMNAAPMKGGSVWGTDGGSVGGHVGLTKGEYVLNKSGSTGARFLAALQAVAK